MKKLESYHFKYFVLNIIFYLYNVKQLMQSFVSISSISDHWVG
jgi:hypothetical protein